jgi:hypothetical protein
VPSGVFKSVFMVLDKAVAASTKAVLSLSVEVF